MNGLWRGESDLATLTALDEIHRGLEEGDRQVIANGFDQLGRATSSAFWMFDATWVAWPDETATNTIVVANPITGEWLHFDPASKSARRMSSAIFDDQGERRKPPRALFQ
jgi:hypothetical protein